MRSRSFKASVFGRLLPLAMTLCLAGCLSTGTTRSSETDVAITDGVCSVWVGIPYKSADWNQLEVRANNAARSAFCEKGR